MRPLSPAWRTDLLFARLDGSVEDRGDHLVVRTPGNPFYFWGNFLLFEEAPADEAELDRRRALFAEAFADEPDVRHEALGWDPARPGWGAAEALLQPGSGWDREDGLVLATSAAQPAHRATPGLRLRRLTTPDEWEASRQLGHVATPGTGSGPRRDAFLDRLHARYRAMAEAGLGVQLGAFDGDRLVAHLGLFRDRELARFQRVETHPDWRRRGACGALVAEAQAIALGEWGVERLVIVAEPGSEAERIYRRAGCAPIGRQCGVQRGL